MFDKDGIKKYLGGNSGNSYAAGLTNVERKYSPVDIDAEFEKDECASLLSILEKAKFEPDLEPKEKSQRQDNYSHLKKYIYFKRYKRFISWLSEQPQKNDPTKRYAPQTVEAAANCIRKGLSTLSVFTYKEADCFSITDPDEFKKLYDRCYSSAEEYDKKNGHSDFRNGLDFYYSYLKGGNREVVNPMASKIREIISKYKADFERVNQEERYKWEAVGCYKRNWNIEADNFSEMYAEAFKEASNLLSANMYWPYKMVITFAEQEPGKVRELFKMLYNEEIPLAQRYVDFRAAFDEFYKPQKLNHYQDLHAISVYLSFEYPDKYRRLAC